MCWSCGDSLTQNDRYPSYFVLIGSHLTVRPVSRLTCAATSAARVFVASLVTKGPTCRFSVVPFVVDVLFLAASIFDERPLPMIGAAQRLSVGFALVRRGGFALAFIVEVSRVLAIASVLRLRGSVPTGRLEFPPRFTTSPRCSGIVARVD